MVIQFGYDKKFEKDHVNLFPYLNGDMHTDEWTPSVWDYFEDKDAFSRAARTKQNELIKKGVDPKQIIIQRIDGDMKVINGQIYLRGGNNNLIQLWNQDWSTYADIMELHFYTHGYQGHAYMYNSDKSKLEDPTLYPKLNWNKCGKLYLHGCHTAQIFYDDETKPHIILCKNLLIIRGEWHLVTKTGLIFQAVLLNISK